MFIVALLGSTVGLGLSTYAAINMVENAIKLFQ